MDMTSLNSDVLAALAGMLVGIIIVLLIVAVLMVIASWAIFTKAGEPGWKSLIPVYSQYTMYKVAWNPNMFWVSFGLSVLSNIVTKVGGDSIIVTLISLLISIASLVVSVMFLDKLSKAFGHGTGFTVGLFFLQPIFYLILAFGSSEYEGAQE